MNIEALIASLSDAEKKSLLKTLQQSSKNNEKAAEQKLIDENNDIVGKSFQLLKYGKTYGYCHVISPYAACAADVTVFMFETEIAYNTVKAAGNHFGRSFDNSSKVFGGKICEMSHASFTKADSTSVAPISWEEFKNKYTDYCVRLLTKLNDGFFGMESSSQKTKPTSKQPKPETHETAPAADTPSDNTPPDNTEP